MRDFSGSPNNSSNGMLTENQLLAGYINPWFDELKTLPAMSADEYQTKLDEYNANYNRADSKGWFEGLLQEIIPTVYKAAAIALVSYAGAGVGGAILGPTLGGAVGGASGGAVGGMMQEGGGTVGSVLTGAALGGISGGVGGYTSDLDSFGNSMALAGGGEGVPTSAYLAAYDAAQGGSYGALNGAYNPPPTTPDYYNGAGLGSDYAGSSPSPTPDYYNGAGLGSSYGLNTGNPTPNYYDGAGLGSAAGYPTDTSIDYLSKAKDLAKEYGPDAAKKLLKLATNSMMGTILPYETPAVAAQVPTYQGSVSSPQAAIASNSTPTSLGASNVGWNNISTSLATNPTPQLTKSKYFNMTPLEQKAEEERLRKIKESATLVQSPMQQYLQSYLA